MGTRSSSRSRNGWAGMYAPSPGVVYPMLTMLEEMGHATVVTEGARKLYTITEEGSKALAENKAQVDALFARMDQVRGEHGGERAQQIERAVANFRMALRMKKRAADDRTDPCDHRHHRCCGEAD